jgi:hypothetical protein
MKNLLLTSIVALTMFCVACGSNNTASTPAGTGAGSFSAASLTGQFVYQISGVDLTNSGAPYRECGVFTADGKGNIVSGSDDFAEGSGGVSNAPTTGTYAISNDGTGTLNLNFSGGTLQFAITLLTTGKAYMIETDTFANGAGLLEMQVQSAITSVPSGTFVFRVHNSGTSSMAGAITVSGGVITGSDDVILSSGSFDNNTGAPLTLSGTLNSPSVLGRGTGSITDSAGDTSNFIYYIVDSNNIRMLTSDTGVVGIGRAERQTSTAYSNSSLSGSYVFGSRADDSSYLNGQNTVGVFTSSGSGSISTGMLDSVRDGASYAQLAVSGSYAVTSNGRATVTLIASGLNNLQEVLWMVSPSRAFFVTDDVTKVEDGTLDQQVGSSFSISSVNGQYAFDMDGFDLNQGVYLDRVGWISLPGNGSLTWNEVANASGGLSQPGFLTGSYTAGSNGRVAATVGNLSQNNNDIVFYLVSGSSAYMLQNDPGVQIVGNMALQP